MIRKIPTGVFLLDGRKIIGKKDGRNLDLPLARKKTMSHGIFSSHNRNKDDDCLSLRCDAVAAHDMTYIGVLQTAIACGISRFDIPFIMTDCHNSLCAMAGTFNEDDHIFSLSAARKFGGIKIPSHMAIVHQYMREAVAGCGKFILGADSHTRYGALGSLAIGEGAGEIVKQLLGGTYDIRYPETVLVFLEGEVKPGVGPHDVVLSIIGEVFKDGFVKNRVLEFCGPGLHSLSMDFRNGMDTMTTEASSLSSIWQTDEKTESYLKIHGRKDEYKEIRPGNIAYYDRAVIVDLSGIEPVIAMPFHPSNVYRIDEFNENPSDILAFVENECNSQLEDSGVRLDLQSKLVGGRLKVDQGVIAGCAGGLFSNLSAAADILEKGNLDSCDFSLHVYPASQPIMKEIISDGIAGRLVSSGADLRSAFCGPCFGAGDIPGQMGFSIRHTTRNYANREGSRPAKGQIASVALMDARSICATAINGGFLTSATRLKEVKYRRRRYFFDSSIYEKRGLNLFGKGNMNEELIMGPNIRPIPSFDGLGKHLLLKVASFLPDPVTTTDELIPGGESTSYRSNLLKLADYALSTRDPGYVPLAKSIRKAGEEMSERGQSDELPELADVFAMFSEIMGNAAWKDISFGSVLVSRKPGDGSAREYAATCQRVLGGIADISMEYATKRYRSNLINWGILPFVSENWSEFLTGSYVFVPDVKSGLETGETEFRAFLLRDGKITEQWLSLEAVLPKEREILASGCLINFYKKQLEK